MGRAILSSRFKGAAVSLGVLPKKFTETIGRKIVDKFLANITVGHFVLADFILKFNYTTDAKIKHCDWSKLGSM